MPKIAVVDEQSSDANQTILKSVQTGVFDEGDLISMQPTAALSEMVEKILESGCSALLADFKLREAMPAVNFNGIELVTEIQNQRLGFPCFLTTSYAPEALRDRFDPNRIYSKRLVWADKTDGEVHFFERVSADIREWESKTADASSEHAQLRAKAREDALSPAELVRLIELDTFIENRFVASEAMDAPLKSEAISRFNEISDKAEQLIEELTQALDGVAEQGEAVAPVVRDAE